MSLLPLAAAARPGPAGESQKREFPREAGGAQAHAARCRDRTASGLRGKPTLTVVGVATGVAATDGVAEGIGATAAIATARARRLRRRPRRGPGRNLAR